MCLEGAQALPEVHGGRSVLHQHPAQLIFIHIGDPQYLLGLMDIDSGMLWPQSIQHARRVLPAKRLLAHQAPATLAVVQHHRPIATLTRSMTQAIGAACDRLMHFVIAPVDTDPATLILTIAPLLQQTDRTRHRTIICGIEMP